MYVCNYCMCVLSLLSTLWFRFSYHPVLSLKVFYRNDPLHRRRNIFAISLLIWYFFCFFFQNVYFFEGKNPSECSECKKNVIFPVTEEYIPFLPCFKCLFPCYSYHMLASGISDVCRDSWYFILYSWNVGNLFFLPLETLLSVENTITLHISLSGAFLQASNLALFLILSFLCSHNFF